jgi:hypothetical protein
MRRARMARIEEQVRILFDVSFDGRERMVGVNRIILPNGQEEIQNDNNEIDFLVLKPYEGQEARLEYDDGALDTVKLVSVQFEDIDIAYIERTPPNEVK